MPVEPEYNVRAELLTQIETAQATLESQLDALRDAAAKGGDGTALLAAQSQLAGLGSLSRRVEHAHGSGLVSVRAEIAAFVAATQATVQQVRGATASAVAAEAALHKATAEAHRITGSFLDDFYEKKIFDPYLRFASPDDERAYREREDAYRRAIEAARAEGTPEGELRAVRLSREQLEDAGRHGADASPDYASRLAGLSAAEQNLAQAATTQQSAASEADLLHHAEPAQPELVSPDIIASLRTAGVTPASEAAGNAVPRTAAPRGLV